MKANITHFIAFKVLLNIVSPNSQHWPRQKSRENYVTIKAS